MLECKYSFHGDAARVSGTFSVTPHPSPAAPGISPSVIVVAFFSSPSALSSEQVFST